jgi:hypothetical protein
MSAQQWTPEQIAAYYQQHPEQAPPGYFQVQQAPVAPVQPAGLGANLNQIMGGAPGALPPGVQPQTMGGGASFLSRYDCSQIQTSNFELLPTNHPIEFRVAKIEARKNAAQEDQLVVTLISVFPLINAGVTVMDWITLNDKGLWKFKSLYLATGLGDATGSRFVGQSEQDFVGKYVRCMIKHQLYTPPGATEGEDRNKVNGGYQIAKDFLASQAGHAAAPAPTGFPQAGPPQGPPPGFPPQGPPAGAPPPPQGFPQGAPPPPPGAVAFAPPQGAPPGAVPPGAVSPPPGVPTV